MKVMKEFKTHLRHQRNIELLVPAERPLPYISLSIESVLVLFYNLLQVTDTFFILLHFHYNPASQRQFRHYYIYGSLSKCEQEQSNWTNCLSWKTTKSQEAKVS